MGQEIDFYYAVIFTAQRKESDRGYKETADQMMSLVKKQRGFLGVDTVRSIEGFGITVSYWDSLESIDEWKENVFHRKAKSAGRSEWYKSYRVQVARVEKSYGTTKH